MSGEQIWKSPFGLGRGRTSSGSPKASPCDTSAPSEPHETPSLSATFREAPSLLSGLGASSQSALGAQTETESDPASSGSLEQLLLSQMDKAVVGFAEIMADNTILKSESGKETPRYSAAEKIKAFELVNDYVARRHKLLRPDTTAEDDAPHIESLRAAMREEIDKTLDRQQVVRLKPNGRKGRPRKVHKEAERLTDQAARGLPTDDDSELQRALGGQK